MSEEPKKTRRSRKAAGPMVRCQCCGYERKHEWALNHPCVVCNTWWEPEAEAVEAEEDGSAQAEETLKALFAGL